MGGCLCSENRTIISKYVRTNSINDSKEKNNFSLDSGNNENNNCKDDKYPEPKIEKIEINENQEIELKNKLYKNRQTLQTNHTNNTLEKRNNKQITPKKRNTSAFDVKLKNSLSLKGKLEINIVLIGEKQSGKSSFIIKLIENRFESLYIPTVFIERCSKVVIFNNKQYILNFEVTPGVEEYKEDYSELYSKSNFVLLFYEVGKQDSLKRAKNYVKKELKNQILLYSNNTSNIYFIGNKIDLYPEQNNSDIMKYCEKHQINFFEISVKTNAGINSLMSKIIESFDQVAS